MACGGVVIALLGMIEIVKRGVGWLRRIDYHLEAELE